MNEKKTSLSDRAAVSVEVASEKLSYYLNRVVKRPVRSAQVEKADMATFNANLAVILSSPMGGGSMIARFGGNEVRACAEAIAVERGLNRRFSARTRKRMKQQAGFFPADTDSLMRFYRLMVESVKRLDWLGTWDSILQPYAIEHMGINPGTRFTSLGNLEPYYYPENPWSKELEGKRVLVIHPFAETIESQYRKRERLFPGTDILPEFELVTLKAVQTIAGEVDDRFDDWFEALKWMEGRIAQADFDVAIIGCGAYGFPLAAKVKDMGKVAIHLGGATQILFGIKGARWDSNQKINRWYNEAWTRPSESDKPKNAAAVESACYW